MIQLTEFKEEDINQLISWVTNMEDLLSWAGNQFSFPLDPYELNKYFQNFKNKPENFKAFNIELKDLKIGHCELANINTIEEKSGFIAKTYLKKEHRQKGYGVLAMTKLLNYGFGFLNRIILGVMENNGPAIKCYEKIGFTLVKEKTSSFEIEGKLYKVLWMDLRKEKYNKLTY